MPDEHSEAPNDDEQRGDLRPLEDTLEQNRDQFYQLVAYHMDRRLWGKVEPSDVVERSFTQARARFSEFAERSSMPVSLWIRQITMQTLIDIHRRYLGVLKQDIGVSLRR